MKKEIIMMGITVLVIVACFLIYWLGYTNGYKTAGQKYYYDGMKVDYAFRKINENYQRMLESSESIQVEINDSSYVGRLYIYDNKFVKLSPDTLHFGKGFPNEYYGTKGDEIIVFEDDKK
jgi:hypothetical protein